MPHGLILSALTVLVIVAGGLLWHTSSPFRRRHENARISAATAMAAGVALASCDDGDDFDVTQQIGPDPVRPEPH